MSILISSPISIFITCNRSTANAIGLKEIKFCGESIFSHVIFNHEKWTTELQISSLINHFKYILDSVCPYKQPHDLQIGKLIDFSHQIQFG